MVTEKKVALGCKSGKSFVNKEKQSLSETVFRKLKKRDQRKKEDDFDIDKLDQKKKRERTGLSIVVHLLWDQCMSSKFWTLRPGNTRIGVLAADSKDRITTDAAYEGGRQWPGHVNNTIALSKLARCFLTDLKWSFLLNDPTRGISRTPVETERKVFDLRNVTQLKKRRRRTERKRWSWVKVVKRWNLSDLAFLREEHSECQYEHQSVHQICVRSVWGWFRNHNL